MAAPVTAVVEPGERDKLLRSPGEVTLTLVGRERRFTYRIKPSKQDGRRWVHVLAGADNDADYAFVGGLYDRSGFHWSAKSQIGEDAASVQAFAWFVRHPESPDVRVILSRPCIRCGRRLTTPDSVLLGYGPECARRVALA